MHNFSSDVFPPLARQHVTEQRNMFFVSSILELLRLAFKVSHPLAPRDLSTVPPKVSFQEPPVASSGIAHTPHRSPVWPT